MIEMQRHTQTVPPVENLDGPYSPRVTCDLCGQEIGDHACGVYMWQVSSEVRWVLVPREGEPLFAHRGHCHDPLESRLNDSPSGQSLNWQPLHSLLLQLAESLGLDIVGLVSQEHDTPPERFRDLTLETGLEQR